MDSEHLIHQLGTVLGLNLAFSDSGTCSVIFNVDEVFFERNGENLFLIAPIASSVGKEDLFQKILEANYLGGETGLACLGLNPTRQEFVLHRVLCGNMDYGEFENALTAFVSTARHWKKQLYQNVASEKASSPQAEKQDTSVGDKNILHQQMSWMNV